MDRETPGECLMKSACLAGLVLLPGILAPVSRAQDDTATPAPPAQGQAPPASGGAAGAPAARPAAPPPGMFMAGPLPHGTVPNYKPVTNDMLLNPGPDDWLQFRRTHDASSYS